MFVNACNYVINVSVYCLFILLFQESTENIKVFEPQNDHDTLNCR